MIRRTPGRRPRATAHTLATWSRMIRQACRTDIPVLADLWARAFQGERTVTQRIEQLEAGGLFGGMETAWLAERDGVLTGAYRAYALHQHMHGAECRVMGLAAVAVEEASRRRGLGRELCVHAISMARERGDVYSILYPFRPAFYEALGWGVTGSLHTYRFRPESLRARGGDRVRRALPQDAPAIQACYERFAQAANGPIRRTQRLWRSHFEGDGVHVFVVGGDHVTGYIIVRFGRASAPEDKPMYVRELIADDHDSYEELLGWVAAQKDAWRIVQYDTSPDEHFAHRLTDPRPPGFHLTRNAWAPAARVIRGPMLRILDLTGAFESRRTWGPAAPLSFGLDVGDPLVPGNNGSFVVDFDGGGAAVRRGAARPLLRLPIAVLAQIIAGELRVKDALMLGLAEADGDVETVDLLLRTERCFRLLDEF
jgi:predicted acetyltransferase